MSRVVECLRCSHRWRPRGISPKYRCPHCRSEDVAEVPPLNTLPARKGSPVVGCLFVLALLFAALAYVGSRPAREAGPGPSAVKVDAPAPRPESAPPLTEQSPAPAEPEAPPREFVGPPTPPRVEPQLIATATPLELYRANTGLLQGFRVRVTGEANVEALPGGRFLVRYWSADETRRLVVCAIEDGPKPAPGKQRISVEGTITGRSDGALAIASCCIVVPGRDDDDKEFIGIEEATQRQKAGADLIAKGGAAGKGEAIAGKIVSGTAGAAVTSKGGTVNVRGYYRKDGTYVSPHTRAMPFTGGRGGRR
jgi:hypothetical protein